MKNFILLIFLMAVASCASMIPKMSDRLYYCTRQLMDDGVKPLEAIKICDKIYGRR